MSPPRTSLWLVPARPERDALRQHIDALAAELGTPTFEPHITLVSGVVDDARAAAAVSAVAARRAPLTLRAGPTEHGPERFKALYVVVDDARIGDLAAELAGELGVAHDPAGLAPHLSLAYIEDLPCATRADLAARHSLRGASWRFDTLMASRPGGDPDDVARWLTIATATTTGPTTPD